MMFGEYHPKFKKLESHDHFNRNTNNKITIETTITGMNGRLGRSGEFSCSGFIFSCRKGEDTQFNAVQAEDGVPNRYVSNELRDELVCTVVSADQNLSYQMSYSTKWTLLSKVTRAFHEKLVDDPDRVNILKGFFENIKSTFLEVEEFGEFNANMSAIAGQMMSNMNHNLAFDFSAYDPSNYFKTLRIIPNEGGEARTFEELGTGQQQILALSFAHAYARSFVNQGLIFVLDEPESHLHPLAQKWLAKQMYSMAADGLQLIITTHSPFFINLDFLEGIYLVTKDEQTEVRHTDASRLTAFCRETGATRASESTIIPFYSAHSRPHVLNGFFANKIILAEGDTEELSLEHYFEAVGLDCLKEGIAVIGVGGKGNIAKWWRLFSCYNIPTFICFDNDAGDDGQELKRRDALKAIGIPDDEVGELLTADYWNINSKFCVFGNDFETTLRASFSRYDEFETEVKELYGNSKPIVAREVAKKLSNEARLDTDEGWGHFERLRDAILEL